LHSSRWDFKNTCKGKEGEEAGENENEWDMEEKERPKVMMEKYRGRHWQRIHGCSGWNWTLKNWFSGCGE